MDFFFSDFHLLQQEFHRHYFPVNFEIFQNSLCIEHLRTAASTPVEKSCSDKTFKALEQFVKFYESLQQSQANGAIFLSLYL